MHVRRRIQALAVLVGVVAFGCGPSQPRADYVQEPVTDTAFTTMGNPVSFGASLHDHPEWRDAAVATIESAEAAHPWPTYRRLQFVVVEGPVQLGDVENTYSGPTSQVMSYLDLNTGQVFLSWWLAGPVGLPAEDVFQLGNVGVELANERCQCESVLLPGGGTR